MERSKFLASMAVGLGAAQVALVNPALAYVVEPQPRFEKCHWQLERLDWVRSQQGAFMSGGYVAHCIVHDQQFFAPAQINDYDVRVYGKDPTPYIKAAEESSRTRAVMRIHDANGVCRLRQAQRTVYGV
jgi:hypothetical protein